MKNPNGPYPGRQLFIGLTAESNPAFMYLVTGRSSQSRERKAAPKDNSIIMGPLGNVPYDWLRHYTAVKYDNEIGLLTVTNGIQTEAIYEMYKLLYHTASAPNKSYLKKILAGANFEPDSLNTPRPAGVITNPSGKSSSPVFLLGIVTEEGPAAWQIKPEPGIYSGAATYQGNIENPPAYDIQSGPTSLECGAKTPQELADFIYNISAENYKGDDIRVCGIGGVRTGNTWKTAIVNRHKD
jgi:IMP cyclohydrolase